MKIHVYWDAADSIYIAEVPELPGCLAHGETYDTTVYDWLNYSKIEIQAFDYGIW